MSENAKAMVGRLATRSGPTLHGFNMTAIYQYRFLLFATFGFLAATGCTSSGFLPWSTASLATSSESESAASGQADAELPPKEAARACLVAAEQLQNSGQVEQAILLYEKARRNDPEPEIRRAPPGRAVRRPGR